MTTVWILISTRGRLQKLRDTLASLPTQAAGRFIEPLVVVDGDIETYRALIDEGRITTLYVPDHKGQTFCRNFALERTRAPIIYAVDDILFHPGAIKNAIEAMDAKFPAWDGVIGFTQKGNPFNPAGVALVGEKFLERYPKRHLFFAGYYHFACQEVHRAAEKLGKFFLHPWAEIYHRHPSHQPKEMDKTHLEARKFKAQDMTLKTERERKGLIWGIDG